MTIEELDTLLEDTKKLPRAQDKVALHQAIALIEIAKQLALLNAKIGGGAAEQFAAAAKKK